jgi:SPP1 gp7 family putative phage head morphogenesis protein
MASKIKNAEARMILVEKASEGAIRNTIRDYSTTRRDIYSDIEKLYAQYSTKSGISVSQLKELMSRDETDKFYKSIENRIMNIGDSRFQNRLLARQEMMGYKARISRLEALDQELYIKLKELGAKENIRLERHLKSTTTDTFDRTMFDLQKQAGLAYSFSGISDTRMNALLRARWSDANFSQRIWTNTTVLQQKLKSTLTKGFAGGYDIQRMKRDLLLDFDVGHINATRLIRTESNRIANQAELEAYKQSEVEYYIYSATLDGRTSDICSQLDGDRKKIEDAQEGVNYPPMHPNCRSTTINDKLDRSKLERSARDKDGNVIKVPATMSYAEWREKYGKK